MLPVLLALAACGREGGSEGSCLAGPSARPSGDYVSAVALEGGRARVLLADGTKVLVPSPPKRIVSTLPGITETVVALGGLPALVGRSTHCNWPPEVLSLPTVDVMPVNVEAIRALSPDLVLVDGTLNRASLALLRRHFDAVLPVESASIPHLLETFDLLGQVFGTAYSREHALSFRRRMDALERKLAAEAPPSAPRVLLLAQTDPLNVLGPGSILDDMLRACGCVNVACEVGRASGTFSDEKVLEQRPEWILLTGGPLPDVLRRRWAGLPAVAQGRVANARSDDLVRGGPRTIGALERLADVLRERLPPEELTPER
jgi:iron complex transport system substrate-binding protein